ncbi:MAG TPA: FAD-dependent oxidoreductase, partial [Candidatus Latescibacteria bacterium]|nr:FAD-dependent oxidoreductase [Candidatus Latescibacterota bacterium]
VVATSQIDFHSLKKAGNSGWRQPVLPYSIPLRCMLAKGFPNLAVAGKCISVDQVVHSSCRMTPTCCAMGQAAGTAAALAIETGVADLRDVPISSLRQTLNADGMELNPARHTAFAPHDTRLDADDHVGI